MVKDSNLRSAGRFYGWCHFALTGLVKTSSTLVPYFVKHNSELQSYGCRFSSPWNSRQLLRDRQSNFSSVATNSCLSAICSVFRWYPTVPSTQKWSRKTINTKQIQKVKQKKDLSNCKKVENYGTDPVQQFVSNNRLRGSHGHQPHSPTAPKATSLPVTVSWRFIVIGWPPRLIFQKLLASKSRA